MSSEELKNIDCWKCGAPCSLADIGDADGQCPRCDAEIDLAGYLQEAWKDYAALEAECERLSQGSKLLIDDLERRDATIEALRAQLAAIQGGMGEAEAEKQLQEWARDKFSFAGRYKGSVYGNTDWALARAIHTDLLAHYQRITAAMAAEVGRLRQDIKNAFNDDLKMATMKEQEQEIIALRAELAEVKGRKPDCFVVGKSEKIAVIDSPLPVGTKLYTTPPASPDVEGLCRLLAQAQGMVNGATDQWHDEVRDALSTWRRAQEGKP